MPIVKLSSGRLGPPAAHLLFTVVGFCYRWPWICEQDSNLQLAPLTVALLPIELSQHTKANTCFKIHNYIWLRHSWVGLPEPHRILSGANPPYFYALKGSDSNERNPRFSRHLISITYSWALSQAYSALRSSVRLKTTNWNYIFTLHQYKHELNEPLGWFSLAEPFRAYIEILYQDHHILSLAGCYLSWFHASCLVPALGFPHLLIPSSHSMIYPID